MKDGDGWADIGQGVTVEFGIPVTCYCTWYGGYVSTISGTYRTYVPNVDWLIQYVGADGTLVDVGVPATMEEYLGDFLADCMPSAYVLYLERNCWDAIWATCPQY